MRRRNNGLTLLELLLALALGVMATLSLIALLIGGLRSMRKAAELTEATSVARELLERIASGQYPHTLANEVFDGKAGTLAVNGWPPAPYPYRDSDMRYNCRVETKLLSPYTALVRVDVSTATGLTVRLDKVVSQ